MSIAECSSGRGERANRMRPCHREPGFMLTAARKLQRNDIKKHYEDAINVGRLLSLRAEGIELNMGLIVLSDSLQVILA